MWRATAAVPLHHQRTSAYVLGTRPTCADIVPIRIIRRKFFVVPCFHDINPCWHFEFARSFKVTRISSDEGFCAEMAKVSGIQAQRRDYAPNVSYSRHGNASVEVENLRMGEHDVDGLMMIGSGGRCGCGVRRKTVQYMVPMLSQPILAPSCLLISFTLLFSFSHHGKTLVPTIRPVARHPHHP